MREQLIQQFTDIVGAKNILTEKNRTHYYRTGFRSGKGAALAVVFPTTLLQEWQVIEAAVKGNCIIIMQAAKTGLTEGSAPSGFDYDREVVIINITRIKKIIMLDGGKQALAFTGSSLFELEQELKKVGRAPHSVIGSSSIGATIVGGIANNSGGALVKRGPAYTELALFAQVDKDGQLHLVNHLGIENLGSTPEEILTRLEQGNIPAEDIGDWDKMASDREYIERVRDVHSDIPARFNADERRLFEASGCAGKIGVFAVRVDTYPVPEKELVFYLGTNDPAKIEQVRCDLLENFENIPDMGEYLHRDVFEIAERYGKDVFLSIKYLGTKVMPTAYAFKSWAENLLNKVPFLPKFLPDRILYYLSLLFPKHLPKRMVEFGERFEHHLFLKMADGGIEETQKYLAETWGEDAELDWFECDDTEKQAALLHRFAAAGAAIRYQTIHSDKYEDILALDVALRRNDRDWVEELPAEVKEKLEVALYYGHFMCHVFHQDYVFKKGTDIHKMKELILEMLDSKGAKYPAEHNVGHMYKAAEKLRCFYEELDPTNTFNPGIGKMPKYKRNCCGE